MGRKKKAGSGAGLRRAVIFDEDSRREYLTGFHKRKVERRKVAVEEIKRKLKEEQRKMKEERHKEYLKMLTEREEALDEADELEHLVTSQTESVSIDHPNHTVTVTTVSDLDLSGARQLGLSSSGGGGSGLEEKETLSGFTSTLPKKSGDPFLSQSWQESLAYTQLSSRAQDEHEDTSTRTDISTDTSTGTGTSATLSGDWEMTRLLDSILGLDKQDTMNYTGQRKEVQIGALQSDRPRWGQTISWGRTESQSFMKEISPQKAESSPVSQSTGDGWAKHQTESSYFSLERRKSDPTWVSSPPRASSSTLPTRSDPVRTGRHLTSSISSLDSDLPGCTRGGGEGRHALVRQEYTVLADLPKPKRISHREAFEQERSSSRTRSPGRAEVERIFGYERRKSETLEAFQALEDGLLDRLDGKTPLLAKEGQLGRRQSSPTLYREGNKRLLQQLEQPGRRGGEALHSVSPARRSERDWRSQVDSMCHMSTDKCMDRERVSPQPLNPGKHTDSNWKSQRDSLHPTNPGKSSDNSWTSRGGHLRSLSPGKHPESNWKSPKETHPVSPVTSTERKWKGAKEPLHPMSAGKRMSARHSLEEKPHLVSPGKCTERDQKGQGKSLRPVSPARKLESDWRSQAETLRSRSPTRQPERDWRSQAETLRSRSPTGRPERDWRGHAETLRSRSPTRQPEKDWRSHAETLRSRRPIGRPERDWRSHAETLRSRSPTGRPERDWRSQVETLRSRSPARQLKRDWRSQEEALCSRSQTQRSEDHWKTQEKCLCHMNPMQQLERDWRSQGECLYSVSSGHQPETKSPVSPSQWLESDMKSHEQSLDLSSEKQLENDRGKEETLLHQEACERSLAEMESLHQQVMTELQRHHQRELERLRQEKERLLAEEAAATAAAIEALKKVHKEELNRELGRTRSFQQSGSGSEALRRQHQLDVDSLKRELQVLSERYSQKCLEIGDLTEKAEEREQMLQRCQQEGKELLRQNQELQTCLSEEIQRLRTFITSQGTGDGALHNGERSSCELEVLLRVKENELQYLKKEVQCLKDELQMMQKDKRFASGKYQDVYVELNHIKLRSEREIEQLKEHLRLAMAALQEKETLRNSISE
ncbi:hypothetical protein KIL84_018565 [Mauremys mutica]|uniref:Nucleolar protein 12 n=1 Tax=Mauremys mutica TaxID=74926 RepID=A0A9D3XTC9_9SAUR|nr:hypothetical protein KIL84_018565 [Mauremys mutica]